MSKTVSVSIKREALAKLTAYKKALTATNDHALCEALATAMDHELKIHLDRPQCVVTKPGADAFLVKLQVPDEFGVFDATFWRAALTGQEVHKPSIPVKDPTRQNK